ncbi:MAG: cysteine desulfurase [Lactococcus sp.]
MFDAEKIRQDFPILDQVVNDEALVYLDNAATTQKPLSVLTALRDYYESDNANVHRGVHSLAERATAAYEASREKVRAFIHAESTKEVLFTRGTTTSLNWVSKFAEQCLTKDDEILISIMEHHSNLVPWQQVADKTGATLKFVGIKNGQLDMEDLKNKLSEKTKFVSMTQVSNALGCINPIKEIAQLAHQNGAYMVVDGAQSTPHMQIDVQDLDADFFAFSGHKMLGPTGIGVLYGKEELLNQMNPVEFGGEMIDFVYQDYSTWSELPWKFEAGTPNIAGSIGLGAAIDYLSALTMPAVEAHERQLMDYLMPKLRAIDGLTIYGPEDNANRSSVVAFNLEGLHPHDLATGLDMEGVAVRAGHHCAQPLIEVLETKVGATARASFYVYNTKADCDKFVEALLATKAFFSF